MSNTTRPTILVVDDNQDIRKQLRWGLGAEDFDVHMAGDVDEALRLFQKLRPQVVTLDLGLPPHEDGATEGLRCLGEMLSRDPQAKVIVITGNEDRDNALQAVQTGAYDYYQKPIDLDELRIIIGRAMRLWDLESENRRLLDSSGGAGELGIVGQCPQIQQVLATIRKVAGTDVPVLVLGESGTGKEVIARAIHAASGRKDGPLVAVNCGAIPENLLESEFFGHEKGAFTGADSRRKGKVEFADKGTLFLDEIGELPPALQVKMLRFLQDRTFQRLGGREDINVDIRVVAATNVDIARAMADGSFREDLYYRISLVTIRVPPLRERGGDILLLANYFLSRAVKETPGRGERFSPAAVEALRAYEWPGNVRELENKVRRATIMANAKTIEPEDLGLAESSSEARRGGGDMPEDTTLREAREWIEKEMLETALRRHGGNISKAAKGLGVSRPTMYDLLKKYNLG